jgi:hypothetical protein
MRAAKSRLVFQGQRLADTPKWRITAIFQIDRSNLLHREKKATTWRVEVYHKGRLFVRSLPFPGAGVRGPLVDQGIQFMRKIVLVAVAALALSACSKEATDAAATVSEAAAEVSGAASEAADAGAAKVSEAAKEGVATVSEAAADGVDKVEDTAAQAKEVADEAMKKGA